MKRCFLYTLLSVGLFTAPCEGQQAGELANAGIVSGTISLPEISAAAAVGCRLLVVADDPDRGGNRLHMIALLDDAVTRLERGGDIAIDPAEHIYAAMLRNLPGRKSKNVPDAETVKDIEDAAVSPQGDIFLISSHSRSKKNKLPVERQRFVRLRIDRDSGDIESAAVISSAGILTKLPGELARSTRRRPGQKNLLGGYNPGFNIEGLAWAPGCDVLVGLRSPTLDKEAVVLRLADANGVFDNPTKSAVLTMETLLDLNGLGIRGMSYDGERGGYWIIAGLSHDSDEPKASGENGWSVWFWNGGTATAERTLQMKLRKTDLPPRTALNNPEAVTLLKKTSEEAARYLVLISDNGAGEPSSYVLVPLDMLE